MANLMHLFHRAMFGLRQSGWQLRVGLMLWLGALLLGFGLVSGLQTQRILSAQLTQTGQKSNVEQKPVIARDITQQFYAILPKKHAVDALSEQILHEADGMGLQFERAEFSEVKTAKSALMQHQIKLPVRGNYVQIRQFLNSLLNTQPTLALTEFHVRRDDVLSDMVEANVLLTQYLRGDTQ